MVRKVVSGGQTGVDRAALDVALALHVPCGGWVPLGRRAEDGPVPARYPLTETPTAAYPLRTEWNVRDSDGTLILHDGALDRGTALTRRVALRLGRVHLVLDLRTAAPAEARRWIDERGIAVLNVAGPRESRRPGVHARAT